MAVLPGVALDELWEVVGLGERALLAASALVALVSLAGLVAVIAGRPQRTAPRARDPACGRRGPRQCCGCWPRGRAGHAVRGGAGRITSSIVIAALGGWVQSHFGIALRLALAPANEWSLLVAVLGAGWLASLVPGYRAYRLSLADGLSPRS